MTALPSNESDRLAALHALNILDTPVEESFDRVVNALAAALDMPMAAISLIDSDRTWFKASKGLAVRELPREGVLCGRTIASDEPLVIEDVTTDTRRDEIGLVLEMGVRAYAGMAIFTHDGHRVGALCAADLKPRRLTEQQIGILKDLAFVASDLLHSREVAGQLRRTEHALQRKQQRLERLSTIAESQIEASLDGILVVGTDRSIISFNRRFVDMWGIAEDVLESKRDELLMQAVLDKLVDPEGFLRRAEEIYQQVDEQVSDELHLRDGRTFDRYTTAVRTREGEGLGRVWFFRDVTEKKQHERKLEEHKLVVENSNAVLFRWRAEEGWPVELVSENVSQFGFTAAELLDGRVNFATLVHPDDIERVTEEVRHFSQIGVGSFEQEYRLICRDGAIRWIFDRTLVERNELGEITHYQGIVIDITERKNNEECSLRLLNDLEERVKEMRTLNGVLELLNDTHDDIATVLQRVTDMLPEGFQRPFATGASIRYGKEFFSSREYSQCAPSISARFQCDDGADGIVKVALQGCEFERGKPALFLPEERQLVTTVARLLGSFIDRIRARQQLQQHKLVVENSNTVLFRWRVAQGWPVEMVSENVRQYGYEASELLSGDVSFESMVHPEDRRRIEGEVVECLEGNGEFVEQEYRILCRNGEIRWVFDRTTAERDVTGTITHFQGTVIDITERKMMEDALRMSEERLRKVASQVPGAVFQFRIAPDGTRSFPYISDGVHELCGISAGELSDDSTLIMANVLPDEVPAVEASIMESARTLSPWRAEFRIRHRNGSTRWIGGNSVPQREPDGGILWHGLITDITERKQAEDKLHRLTAVIEASTDFVGMATAQGKPLYINPAGRRMIGLSPDLPLSEHSIADYSPTWANELLINEALPSAVRDGAWLGELALLHRNGQEIPVSQLILAHKNALGEVEYLSTVIRDVTMQRQIQDALKDARDAAEAASIAKSEFLANMSHEIRTPLTAILGYAELLRDEQSFPVDSSLRDETVETILVAGRHLLTVINDILDISKIEAGALQVEIVQSAIVPLVREAVNLMKERATRKGIAMRVELRTPVPDRIATDPTRLKQILVNLIGNAVKFTHTGSVTVVLAIQDEDDQRQFILDIEDTGPGLTESQCSRLFTAFGQGDSSVTRKHGGTGLGLIISRRLAALLNGNVDLLWTEPGRGSCFRMSLPLVCAANATMVQSLGDEGVHEQPREELAMPSLRGRILLAEDGPENQRLIAFHLTKAGAEVEVANNGAVALEMLQQAESAKRPFDLLLTDIQMPEMDGGTLAKALRNEGSTIPIIALTAHAMAEDRRQCLAAGCDDYAAKPIDRARLLAVCHQWLGKRGGGRSLAA